MKIVLPLPDALTTTFVVAVEQMAFDARSIVPWRVGDPYRRAAIDAVAGGAVTVTPQPVPWKPAATTLTDDERRRLRRTRQHVVVAATAPPHRFPFVAQVARAVARALARECDGLLIDPLTGATVLTCGRCAAEPPTFSLDDDWVSWGVETHDDATCPRGRSARASLRDCPGGRAAGASLPDSPSARSAGAGLRDSLSARSAGAGLRDSLSGRAAGAGLCDCPRVTSRGLRRFALPEITIDGATCGHSLCATNLLRTVGSRLVADHLSYLAAHPEATTRTIDDFLHIPPSDQPNGLPFAVRLTPYDTDTATGTDTNTAPDTVTGTHPDPCAGTGTHSDPCAGTGTHSDPCAGTGNGTCSGTCSGTGPRADGAGMGPRTGTQPHPHLHSGSHPHLHPGPHLHAGAGAGTDVGEPGRAREIRRLMVDPVPGTGQVACLKVGPPPSSSDGPSHGRRCVTHIAPPTPYPLTDPHSPALAA
ncbi:hypothetical protein SAMN05421874_105191 [Nonomuraea maritima]|uniref:Uncharacterized protein n=1 Tax=Nonomuraea maritima TaxID=683260 RepID=A0A1G8ZCB9_9ACTN|nr:hypothetical protein [Nonomuraea maritima]SDK12055.1 hypothetical protein SAMN05421874_105191 [Nonomuraea maritima]